MRIVLAGLILLLVVLHQDYWNWNNSTLWFGFLPHSLAWHVGVSLAAAAAWLWAACYAWPAEQIERAATSDKEPVE